MAETFTLETRIASGFDDVEESASGSIYPSSTDLELVDDLDGRAGQTVGLRFNGIDIPQGAIITAAYLQFQADELGASNANLAIRGVDSDDAAAFSFRHHDVSSRPMTDASAEWVPDRWMKFGEVGAAQRTSDLTDIVQEIVDRDGWDARNSMAFAVTGSGTRTAESFEGGAASAPLLHIEWTLPGEPEEPPEEPGDTTPPTVAVTGPAEGATVSGTIALVASAMDDVGVRGVQFRVDSENIGSLDTSAPYSFDLDTSELSNGTVAITAVATDIAGNETISSPITVTIDNSGEPEEPPEEPGDTTPPTVAVTGPAEGATVSGTIALVASAMDDVGLRGVQFRVDSEDIGSLDTSAPYSLDLDTSELSNGTVAITAVATDIAGNETISSPITVTIDNSGEPPPPPPPPSGTIRVPEDYATIQDAIDAAGDGDTVVVGPGTYDGGIVIAGKSITLTSAYETAGDAAIDSTIISGGAPGIYVDDTAPNTVVQGFHFVGGDKSIQFFAPGGEIRDSFFEDAGSDAISFEDVGGTARGNHVVNAGDDAVDVDAASSDVLIEDNVFQFSDDDGIEIRNQNYSGPHVTHTIRNNVIEGSGEDGVQIIDYSDNSDRSFVIDRNLIRDSADVGIGLMDDGETIEDFRAADVPERVLVTNNTIDGNRYGITGGDNLVALNNIISNSSVLGLKNVDGNSEVAYTLFFGNADDQTGSNVDTATTRTGDPRFTDEFGLQLGSPAIDAGTISYVLNGETLLDLSSADFSGLSADLGWREFLLL